MDLIKVNTIHGDVVVIDTNRDDWVEQLAEATKERAVIRTPKGYSSAMKNLGYSKVGECSKYVDLWVSDGVPHIELPQNPCVFMIEDPRYAMEFVDSRIYNSFDSAALILNTTKYPSMYMFTNRGLHIDKSCLSGWVNRIPDVYGNRAMHVVVVVDAKDIEAMGNNRLNALSNAVAKVERNAVRVDFVVIGHTNWTVNFKEVFIVDKQRDDLFVCSSMYKKLVYKKVDTADLKQEVYNGIQAMYEGL